MKNVLALVLLAAVLYACSTGTKSPNKFADETLVKIYDLRDRRMSDSLVSFFQDKNPLYRKEAALAFASVQDSTVVNQLEKLLQSDADTSVRKAAAFALGQTRSIATPEILLRRISQEEDASVKEVMLVAFGKTTKNFVLPDGVVTGIDKTALAWALYYAGLNNATDSADNKLAVSLLTDTNAEATRLGAAHYFSRSAKGIDRYFASLEQAARKDTSANVRMAAAAALRKILTDSSLTVLRTLAEADDDYRVRVNATRAMQAFPFSSTKDALLKLVDDKNAHVAVTASEVVKSKMEEAAWIDVANKAGQVSNWRAQANLYEAVLKVTNAPMVVNELTAVYNKSTNIYQRASLLAALQHNTGALEFLISEFEKADTAVIQTTAAAAIVSINALPQLNVTTKDNILAFYKRAIEKGDPGVIGIIAGALQDPRLGYASVLKDITFLRNARAKLSMPKDLESIQPLESAIAYLEGKEVPTPSLPAYNHPIDWASVTQLPANQIAYVYTSRGKITLRLLVEEAPGSVINFVTLANSNYYDKKAFHRVVPNFVIQGGCNRGDGSGSLDYSIRSEFGARKYTTGSVGMASAGKDTEGVQWFITHSPTPHLDGRYTIFAEVIEGMEAVQQLEQGDLIEDVVIVTERP
jgi:cyclophilin family peptidyl-prolyl cis-trans isomerase/HEAT repeat protein